MVGGGGFCLQTIKRHVYPGRLAERLVERLADGTDNESQTKDTKLEPLQQHKTAAAKYSSLRNQPEQ